MVFVTVKDAWERFIEDCIARGWATHISPVASDT